ncbi:DNA topoisomerase (ATP-hydrolyzing) subunit B [Anaerosalibacter bizertensis]|uniref:DNA gyrase subunit B n=1 Tax=Anaerosalibacter bizertensis TaxID=932217 RepID=A0A844FK36_9FIRM|nr:DNA topoisomerase (ATP-hydrolyzing) subunit B [Anaerosalibacter bizertensis]MBV1817259.1 DNA topoisomerase (ATP-hydrolyzing) subunit B [Bacteroidales bacterium MSK.15.36]MCB5560138.1 DNA topoisomerase (ATP-hydrolyzing) subunit B [Anaerosalibacter bizertensis]MCG4565352.1 DNA topoisomerase (ATP-hydrolyzing) subunit B [Anaerosalibacter bizertensis]MCG4582421.1 DNA topoisomerase (ATP-hydrolyzing) subunit B [Anaerosalibacter bizertensis]MCG4584244.1 DNA topoisomerase (ATP-hydrolyzing) subunit B
MTKEYNNRKYTADEIQVLTGLEPVRLRPGMYIGSTGPKGLHHLVYEVVDNSIDEALAGVCDTISITINEDNSVSVSDNGSGIPVETHPQTGKSTVETVLTILHAGGKFNNGAYKVSGGLHGVGISVVNALSEYLEVEVKRNSKIYEQKFSRGVPTTELKIIGDSDETGTTITFKPDKEIFDDVVFDFETLEFRFREMAFLNKGIKILLEDKRSNKKEEFHYEGGIKAFVEYINKNKTKIQENIMYFEAEKDNSTVELAMQYTESYSENIFSFANNINTHEGGTHLSGFKSAITRAINDYARRHNILKEKDDNFQGNDVREGLTAVLSVKLMNPQFEGQTKTKLGNSEMRGIVDTLVSENIDRFLEENPKDAKVIIERAMKASHAREAARKARELSRKRSILDNTTLPGKLADCSLNDPEVTEVFIVEGDSAGGSAKQGRDRRYQAILPLRGKIMNVEKARLDRVLGFEEIKAMITAFGCGIGSEFDIDKLRYGKIIIMTDADVDGAHIRTLLLTFFFRYMKPLVENGHIYIAQPPLYKISKGKTDYYAYSDNQLDKVMNELGRDKEYPIQRYKGLGEMNPEQLWETTMDPETRTILQVSVEDALAADEIFTMLMGDRVKPRREFIQKNAKLVKNLDI